MEQLEDLQKLFLKNVESLIGSGIDLGLKIGKLEAEIVKYNRNRLEILESIAVEQIETMPF